ncbi:MAG: hypothetical protein RML45_09680 [Acetobacteraceae bacterium]|nr:hypothetical protein [Acetobacteraceae bacterium]
MSEPSTPPAHVLLAWYDRHRRDLPWRAPPGARPDPYRVWLSEIMLQQTTVAAVAPRFASFLARFPTVEALAAAPWEEVARAWAGLGYYARARNLHAAAKVVAERGALSGRRGQGCAPCRESGDYTAAAIAAIAFGRPEVPVDGNVERVVARLFAVAEPLPGARGRLRALARASRRAGGGAGARPGTSRRRCSTSGRRCARRAGPPAPSAPGARGAPGHRAEARRHACRARRRRG